MFYKLLSTLIFSLALFFSSFVHAELTDDRVDLEYSAKALRNAKSLWFVVSQSSDKFCSYEKDLVEASAPLIEEVSRLGISVLKKNVVTSGVIPDLSLLISTESTRAKDNFSEDVCSIYIKVESLHTMEGNLRYQKNPIVLRVLVHRYVFVGAVKPSNVHRSLNESALHGIALFVRDLLSAQFKG